MQETSANLFQWPSAYSPTVKFAANVPFDWLEFATRFYITRFHFQGFRYKLARDSQYLSAI